jgi:DNA-binding response OmpR family regulator
MMPYKSGLEITAYSKANIPVIIVSALGRGLYCYRRVQTRCDDFISKPFNPIELTLKVKRFFTLMNISKHLVNTIKSYQTFTFKDYLCTKLRFMTTFEFNLPNQSKSNRRFRFTTLLLFRKKLFCDNVWS